MALNEYYFKSKDIKIFPSSFRGTYKTTDGTDGIFDPESRLNTEANFIAPKRALNKDSYIVEYSENIIKFVLGGYYFELANLSEYTNLLNGTTLGIKLRKISLTDDANTADPNRKTKILNDWENTTDYILDKVEEGVSYFIGLKVLTGTEIFDNSIQLFDENGNINQKALLVDLVHGEGENTLLHGEGLVANYENQTVFGTYNDNKENTLFEVGIGSSNEDHKNALEIKSDETNIRTDLNIIPNNTDARVVVTDTETTLSSTGEININTTNVNIEGSKNLTTTAPATTINAGTSTTIKTPTLDIQNNDGDSKVKIEDDKVTINLSTELNNNLTVASGKKTTLSGNTEVKGNTHITSTADYNSSNQTAALKVDGGTNILKKLNVGEATTLKNTLTVTGDTILNNNLTVADGKKTTLGGQLEVNGTVDINAQTNITGTVNINTNNQSNPGAVTIYGDTTINSDLSTSGNTTLGGDLEVGGNTQLNNNLTVGIEGASKATTLNGTLQVTGDATLGRNLAITGKATLSRDLEVGGATTLKNTLTVGTEDESKATTLNGTLEVTGNTTLGGNLAITGKATSTSTTADDEDTTLTTKDYVDSKITALDVTSVGEDGSYLKTISETDGKITATSQAFDTTISGDSTNDSAPTSKAVVTYVDRYLIINEIVSVGTTYDSASWQILSLDSKLYSNYKIVGATATSYLNESSYKQETWDIGKNEGDHLKAENTLYWANGIYIRWDNNNNNLYILNTNAKHAIDVSLLIMLERRS